MQKLRRARLVLLELLIWFAIRYRLSAIGAGMDESTHPEAKQPDRRPSPLLWIAIILIVIGSLTASTSLIGLAQPVSEENLWTVLAIPFLIAGGCLTFVGVVVLIINGAVRGSAIHVSNPEAPST
jgi:hypothetical protein